MLRSNVFATMSIVFVLGAAAYAEEMDVSSLDTGGDAVGAKVITIDEFRARCERPKGYPEQLPPEEIKIQCTDVQREWVQAAPGDIPLQGSRYVGTAVLSQKFRVEAQGMEVPVFAKKGTCQRFKQIEKVVSLEQPLTCNDLMYSKKRLEDICVEALDRMKGNNPKLVRVKELDIGIDTCAGVLHSGSGKGGR